MTTIASYEAIFRAAGVENVKKAFNEIAQAAKTAAQQERELARTQQQAAKYQANVDRQRNKQTNQSIAFQKRYASAQQQQAQADKAFAVSAITKFAAVAAIIGVATKKTYEFSKAGAQLEYTKIKFDRLSKSAGSTGNIFLQSLRYATRGTVSDFKAMELGSNLLQLGLAKNTKEATRLSSVMTALGMDVGEVTLALANQSKRRLDQLGLSLTKFNEIESKLKSKMPGATKEQIFTEAFLQTAESTVATTGNMADSDFGTYQRFEASKENISNSFKMGMAKIFTPVLEYIANGIEERGRVQPETTVERMKKLRTEGGKYDVMEMGDEQLQGVAREQLKWEQYGNLWGTQLAQQGGQETPKNYEALLQGGVAITTQTQQIAEATKALNEQLKEQQANLATLNEQGYAPTNAKMVETRDNIQQLKTQLAEVGEAQVQAANELMMQNIAIASSEEEKAKNQLDYALASGQMTQEAYNQQAALMGIADAFAAGKINAEQAAKMAELVMTRLMALDGMSVDAMINLVVNGGGLGVTSGFGMGVGGQTVGGGGVKGNTAPPIQMQATGGPLGRGWTLVGEQGPELISPKRHVYTAQQTKKMLPHMSGYSAHRVGGDIGDPTYDPGDVLVFGPTGSANAMSSPLYTSGASGGSSSSYSVPSVAEIASSIAEPIVAGVGQQVNQQSIKLEIQVAEMTRETKKTNDLLGAIYAKVASDNGVARAVAEVGYMRS